MGEIRRVEIPPSLRRVLLQEFKEPLRSLGEDIVRVPAVVPYGAEDLADECTRYILVKQVAL